MIGWRRTFCFMLVRGVWHRDWEQEAAINDGSWAKRFIGGEWP